MLNKALMRESFKKSTFRFLIALGCICLNQMAAFAQVSKVTELSVFHETFDSETNGWQTYTSTASRAEIIGGQLSLYSGSEQGTSRFIQVDHPFEDFSVEGTVIRSKRTGGVMAGLIFGHSDWDNYWYFTIKEDRFFFGYYAQGVHYPISNASYTRDVLINEPNIIKVVTNGDYLVVSINKTVQTKTRRKPILGQNCGFVVRGKAGPILFDDLIVKELSDTGGSAITGNKNGTIKSTGTGFLLSKDGLVATNYHVVEGNRSIQVDVYNDGNVKTYDATVVREDKDNDLALIQITNPDGNLPSPKFTVKQGTPDIGSSIYTIGYPLALSGMGVEPKFTDGKVSSKSGYNNAINSFQTNIGVQPGNSGGPVFNSKGELVGIINAKVFDADNVSYAVKVSYLMAVLDSLDQAVVLPEVNSISNLETSEQLKGIIPSVVLIKIK
jgi:S1-C subfamily serine protease